MRVFVSYARRDRATVDALLQDIRRARHDVWVDEELTGGQRWWDTILGTIRGADVFVIALSPDWLTSKACAAELQYAVACNRALLPIMVGRVSPQMAPQVIANAQILDYLERTPDAAIGLVTALSLVRPAEAAPQPLPEAPPVPMSYMNTYRERVDELNLTFQQQSLLLSELRARMADDDDRDSALELVRRLRRRGDITESIGKEIDALVAATPEPVPPTPTRSPERATPTSSAVSAAAQPGWYADPYRRYDQRYWDGTTWTQHASRGGQQFLDAPTTATQSSAPQAFAERATVPQPVAPVAKWDTGTFITLLIVSFIPCIGLIGVVVGLSNLKKPARRGQAMALLIIGIGMTALIFANGEFHFGSNSG
ncbi:MAG: TIR domain-containing protein [Ilumatobacteraceae bacterium]